MRVSFTFDCCRLRDEATIEAVRLAGSESNPDFVAITPYKPAMPAHFSVSGKGQEKASGEFTEDATKARAEYHSMPRKTPGWSLRRSDTIEPCTRSAAEAKSIDEELQHLSSHPILKQLESSKMPTLRIWRTWSPIPEDVGCRFW